LYPQVYGACQGLPFSNWDLWDISAMAPLKGRGERIAVTLLRKRGLWQRFAADRLGLPADHLEEPAHRIEHHLDEALMVMLEHEENLSSPQDIDADQNLDAGKE